MSRFDAVTADAVFTIGELSARFGVSLRTLRFYEERELLRPRRYGHLRLYTETDKIRLEIVLKGKRLGFSLAEIWKLLQAQSRAGPGEADDVTGLGLSQRDIEVQLDRLTRKRTSIIHAIAELHEVLAKSSSP